MMVHFTESLNVFINSVKNYFDKDHRLLKVKFLVLENASTGNRIIPI